MSLYVANRRNKAIFINLGIRYNVLIQNFLGVCSPVLRDPNFDLIESRIIVYRFESQYKFVVDLVFKSLQVYLSLSYISLAVYRFGVQ